MLFEILSKRDIVFLTPYVLPELNANHPHHNTKSPITALTGEPKGSGSKPLSYLPNRGPNIIALAKAELPPDSSNICQYLCNLS